jgi:hypothetical protein
MKKQQIPFDEYYMHNYATETLINGNTSECIKYLQGLMDYGKAGILTLHNDLLKFTSSTNLAKKHSRRHLRNIGT